MRGLRVFAPLVLFVLAFAASSAKANPLHYDLSLSLNLAQSEISGVETIMVGRSSDSVLQNLSLKGLEIDSIRSEGGLVQFRRIGDSIVVARSGSSMLKLWYHGKPTTGLTMKPSEIYTAFHSQGWMVCDMRPRIKATIDLCISLPSDLTVVASGNVTQRTIAGKVAKYHFQSHVPVSAYLFGFACGHFRVTTRMVGNTVVRLCSREFSDVQRDSILKITSDALRYFERITGKTYPFGSYTEVFTDDDNEQEETGYCLLSNEYLASVLKEPREDWLIIHELAHQWFGNSITCRNWSDFWLNEGMVTFLTAEYKGIEFGKDEFDREMYLARARYSRMIGTSEDRPIVWNIWKRAEDMSGIITYYKGALVLNYLKYIIGDKAFRRGLKSYAHKHWLGTATTSDLQGEFEKASGKNLHWFFEEWVYGSKVPRLSATYFVRNDSLIITVRQDSSQFRLPMAIAVQTEQARMRYPIVVTDSDQLFEYPLHDSLLSLRIDEGGALPIGIEFQFPISMLLYQAVHEPDALGRADAVLELHDREASMSDSNAAEYHQVLLTLKEHDSSRLVRALGGHYFAQLNGK